MVWQKHPPHTHTRMHTHTYTHRHAYTSQARLTPFMQTLLCFMFVYVYFVLRVGIIDVLGLT